jgi:septal ring-binding cell division protein DamX
MARRGRGQFQFTVVELSVIAVSFAATSALVFLLGFYVGRENAAQHAPLDEKVARIPVGPAPPGADVRAGEHEGEGVRPEEPAAPSGHVPGSGASPAERDALKAAIQGEAAAEQAPEDSEPRIAGIPYTVQVLATRNHREAETLRSDLARRRIGAFVSEVEEAGARWYRVRVGRYDDYESARAMQERIRRDVGLGQAYVVPYRSGAR